MKRMIMILLAAVFAASVFAADHAALGGELHQFLNNHIVDLYGNSLVLIDAGSY